ncbi:MAG: hypothetical protein FJ143_16105 [Deltaproteobacteria bacterium]|nr:hypothetical protein [Deltaproteobacteria bacterium]
MEERILSALDLFRAGDDDAALGALLEFADELLPALIGVYRREDDAECRAFLVRIAWERREPETLGFIAEALNDPVEEVWQSALDGSVALASEEILDLLRAARGSVRADPSSTRRFQLCIDEAILYVDGLLQGGQRPR